MTGFFSHFKKKRKEEDVAAAAAITTGAPNMSGGKEAENTS